MKVYFSRSSVTDLTKVKLKTPLQEHDLSNLNAALHIGGSDPFRVATLIFPDCSTIVDLGIEYFENMDLKGDDSFTLGQKKEKDSPCTSTNRYFLFITNVSLTENGKFCVADQNSMFISQERWIDAFSPLFERVFENI
jgi:hypothetical protein